MYRIMIYAFVTLSAVQTSAKCMPPRVTMFACEFETSDRQVEVCGIPFTKDMNLEERYTYRLSGLGNDADLFFNPTVGHSNLRHYGETVDDKFFGVGFEHLGQIYALYATGSYKTDVLYAGFLEIYSDLEQYSSDKPNVEMLHLECKYFTLRGNYDFFSP